MRRSCRGSCCDQEHKSLTTMLKQPTIWTVTGSDLVSLSQKRQAVKSAKLNGQSELSSYIAKTVSSDYPISIWLSEFIFKGLIDF